MTNALIQFALALFGLTALWLALGRNPVAQKWAPLIGLAGQPFWLWFACRSEAWGLLALSAAYSFVYVRGAWIKWGPNAL